MCAAKITLEDRESGTLREVAAVSHARILDAADRPVELLKMDIERGEYDVIIGTNSAS